MKFRDRIDAGQKLAKVLKEKYPQVDGVVYPLPRGGLPLGIEIARVMELPLGLIIPRKIGHPFSPEYAICAVSESGDTVCNESEVTRVDRKWFEQRVAEERKESQRRRQAYFPGREPLPLEGKTAILVDDGIATGLTMRAAIRDARARKAAHIVVAIPVSPKETAKLLRQEVDDVVALSVDEFYLGSVGAYYKDFNQVSDDEAIAMINQFEHERSGKQNTSHGAAL